MTIDPTQSNAQAALRAFLLAVLPPFGADGRPVEVIAGVVNRVPEPKGTDFVVVQMPRFTRLATNIDDQADCKVTGSVAAAGASFTASVVPGGAPGPAVMTVSAVSSGALVVGAAVTGATVAAGTVIVAQLSGPAGGAGTYAVLPTQRVTSAAMTSSHGILTVSAVQIGAVALGAQVFGVGVASGTVVRALGTGTGGTGTYVVAPAQTLGSRTLSAGRRTMRQEAELAFQLDFHASGNGASDMAQTVSTTFRDPYAVEFFDGLASPLDGFSPLYADDPKYVPYVNEAQQYENRYVLEARLQAPQVVAVAQQYADSVDVGIESVDATYPP